MASPGRGIQPRMAVLKAALSIAISFWTVLALSPSAVSQLVAELKSVDGGH